MTIPDFQSMMLPFLEEVSDKQTYSNREVDHKLASRYGISEDELQEKLQSGVGVFTNRVAWVKSYLKRAELIESPERGKVRITQQGINVLQEKPPKIDINFLKRFESFDWHQRRSRDADSTDQVATEAEESRNTPEEQLISAYQELRESLAEELLEQVKQCSPQFFEKLVVDLLVAMGYGGSFKDASQVIGKARDGGIDGIIKEDKLGLDIVCVQAKRWEGNVGRPIVQSFAGSMEAFRARKGVLITTSRFTSDANEYIKRVERKIVLIDGIELAELMIDYDVGVALDRVYPVKKIDFDQFVEEDI